MTDRGILAFGAYIPSRRISRKTIAQSMAWANPGLQARARGERAICAFDEDSLTMAVEAALDCNTEGLEKPATVALASTTLPFADRDNAAVIVDALGLNEQTNTLDLSASQRAGTAALAAALRSSDESSLIIASDSREARPGNPLELQIGHAAAALHVGAGPQVIAMALAQRAISRDLVDHYRASGERFDYAAEDRWVRDEGFFKIIPELVRETLADGGVTPEQIDHSIFPCPARVAGRLCKTLGINSETLIEDLRAACGDTGAAHPLLLLSSCLEQASPGQHVLLVGFGQGADAFLFRVTDQIATKQAKRGVKGHVDRRYEESSYVRYLAQRNMIPYDWGTRAEFDNRVAMTALYRNRDSVTGFSGGRCEACDTVQFPLARICVNPDCRQTDTQTPVPLSASKGRVKSFTEDWLAATRNPPLQYGNVELEAGGNIMMEFVDCEPGTLAIGMPVEMRFRIKQVDERRHFTQYFWKSAPIQDND